jgi:hypothetical protein
MILLSWKDIRILEVVMGRKRKPPRLWLDERRGEWVVLDSGRFIRTGCAESDLAGADKGLAKYLARKYEPPATHANPLIADMLITYMKEHVDDTRTARNTLCFIDVLNRWWGDKRVSEINPANCKAFIAATTTPITARRYLETLRAAVNC